MSVFPPSVKENEYLHTLVTTLVNEAAKLDSDPDPFLNECVLCFTPVAPGEEHANVCAYTVCKHCLWTIHATRKALK